MTDLHRLYSGQTPSPAPTLDNRRMAPSRTDRLDDLNFTPDDGSAFAELADVSRSSYPRGLSRQDLDDLVDVVVDRIEQRVVDELQRRGRHFTPGAF